MFWYRNTTKLSQNHQDSVLSGPCSNIKTVDTLPSQMLATVQMFLIHNEESVPCKATKSFSNSWGLTIIHHSTNKMVPLTLNQNFGLDIVSLNILSKLQFSFFFCAIVSHAKKSISGVIDSWFWWKKKLWRANSDRVSKT